MPGIIEKWNQKRIAKEGWTRLAIRPPNRYESRKLLVDFKNWFLETGRGKCMFWVVDHSRYSTIAFSDTTDVVLFRLTFPHSSVIYVPQPLCHETFATEK